MIRAQHLRESRQPQRLCALAFAVVVASSASLACSAHAQDLSRTPVSVPAGVPTRPAPTVPTAAPTPPPPQLTARQLREADDAYLEGARQVDKKDLAAAEASFAKAILLNPGNRDYALALIVTRESHVTALIQAAAQARRSGAAAHADALLEQARRLDPGNQAIAQHFSSMLPDTTSAAYEPLPNTLSDADRLSATLDGPIAFDPLPGIRDLHIAADPQSALRNVYTAFGIKVAFDSSVNGGPYVTLDLDKVSFADATRIIGQMTHTFAVPLAAKSALLIKDTQENRDQFMPQVEETIYLPGTAPDQMSDFANVARNVFDLRQVTANTNSGKLVVRGEEKVVQELNATFADMLDGGTDVLFDIKLYEIIKTNTRNIGASLPASGSAFDLLQAAKSLITANQSLLNQAIASGVLPLPVTNTATQNELAELLFLVGYGVPGASQFTNLIGVLGTYGGLPLLGLSVASGSTFNLLLNSSDVRMLDAIQIRDGAGQPATFRAGSRYPIITAQYTSGVSSALASSLAGLNINGTSASSLLSKYLGNSTANVPQVQFEDLGLTLKITPQVQHGTEVKLALELKIEALGSQSLNSIPVLNNRALTSTVTVPAGQTAMLATLVSTNEVKSLDGLPGLSELPGFQGTDQNREKDSDELLVTITPHIVRQGTLHFASRRLAAVHTNGSGANSNPPPTSQ